MVQVAGGPLRDRLTRVETELPHVQDDAKKALSLASKATREVESLQHSFAGLASELKQMREMLKRYLQIGSMLALALVLNATSGKAGEVGALAMKALVYALRHSF